MPRSSRFSRLVAAAVLATLTAGPVTSLSLPTATAAPVPAPAPAAAAADLPDGFVQVRRPTGHAPYLLTAFDVLPGGAMLTAGKDGRITWVSADDLVVRTIARLAVRNTGDVGLVGLEAAPSYEQDGRLYTVYAYTAADGKGYHRLSEWTVDDPADPTRLSEERVVLDGIDAGYDVHGATTVVAAQDGTLWLSVGDSAHFGRVDPGALRALDVDDPHGKVLHVDQAGNGVPGNPFYVAGDPDAWRSRVYASGLRSPFRFTLDPRTGTPVVADVGWQAFEEIDVVRPGHSYGWPCWEGNAPTPGYRDLPQCTGVPHTPPAWTYSPPKGYSITGGVFYQGASWPVRYQGVYVFGDYSTQRLWTARIGVDGALVGPVEDLGTKIGGPVQFRSAANGDVMYADLYTSEVVRLAYAPGNRAPQPRIDVSTDPATRTVILDAGGSRDPDGDGLSYAWDLGDGTSGEGVRVEHTYSPAVGSATVALTVTDPLGATTTARVQVTPGNHQPEIALVEPAGTFPGGTFAVGGDVVLSAGATDVEDGALPVSWNVDLVHCRDEACHSHPGATGEGPQFAVELDDHGNDTSLVVRAQATDAAGARTVSEYVARPALRRLSVTANLPAAFTLNGQKETETVVAVGSHNSVQAPGNTVDGTGRFSRWDDGSTSPERTITMPDGDVELSASYVTPLDERYAAEPRLRELLRAPVGPVQTDRDGMWRDYQGGRLYWSPATGVHAVTGSIQARFDSLGGHRFLGYPTTDETTTPDGVGRYNHFTKAASIYWTPATGAHGVWGSIRDRWQTLGWETSYLGYPTTDEYAVPGGTRADFRGGFVRWAPATGAIARRY